MTLTSAAHCHRCDWTAAGDPVTVDRASAKHAKDTGHPTAVAETPVAAARPAQPQPKGNS